MRDKGRSKDQFTWDQVIPVVRVIIIEPVIWKVQWEEFEYYKRTQIVT